MFICCLIEESNMHLCPNWHNISQNLSQQELDYLDYDVEDTISIDWTDLGPSLVVYAVTFVMGILGNVLILVAVIRNTQFLKSSPVNVFLGSLASADLLLISICLPLKVSWKHNYLSFSNINNLFMQRNIFVCHSILLAFRTHWL